MKSLMAEKKPMKVGSFKEFTFVYEALGEYLQRVIINEPCSATVRDDV